MKRHPLTHRARLAALFVPTAIALAACGGSDDEVVAPPAAVPLALTGTAATGAAIAGGAVDAKCASGTGTATTQPDGSYRLEIVDGALPCVLRVTQGGNVLHSLATGTGSSATVNITPVSELVVARLAGGSPAAFFADFSTGPSAAQVQAAVAAVVATLKSAGVDLSGTDVLGGPLVAAHGSTPGNAFDQALDALNAKLAESGITLTQLATTVASTSPAAPPAALNATPSLPAEMLLRAAAPNCSALRSGNYRVVFFAPSGGSSVSTDTLTLDAPTLGIVNSDGSTDSLVANGTCRYAQTSGGTDLVVTQAGIGVTRNQELGVMRIGIVFPEQTHDVSALAGTWNLLNLGDQNGVGGLATVVAGDLSFDASGRMTGGTYCGDLKTCEPEAPDARQTLVANAQGGFDFDGGRVFAYRTGGGELMIVGISPDGAMALGTRKVARSLPTVGDVSRSLNYTLARDFTAPSAVNDSENTIASLAADGLSFMRTSVINFATGATRPETVQINVPLDGFARRVPETVTTSTGATQNVSEWIALTLRGTGITPVAFPATQQLVLSVVKP